MGYEPERRLGLLVTLPYQADHADQPPMLTQPNAVNFFSGLLARCTFRVLEINGQPIPGPPLRFQR
jgi:hypothetical protein